MMHRDKPSPTPTGDEEFDKGSTRQIPTGRPEPIDPDDVDPTPKEPDPDVPGSEVHAHAFIDERYVK